MFAPGLEKKIAIRVRERSHVAADVADVMACVVSDVTWSNDVVPRLERRWSRPILGLPKLHERLVT